MKSENYSAKFTSGDGKPVQGWEAIFPICSFDHRGEIECFGTGFFITVYGIFVTAAHVMTHILDESYQQRSLPNGEPEVGLFMLQFVPPNTMLRRKIVCGICHTKDDVAVGKTENIRNKDSGELLKNRIIPLTSKMPNEGDEVHTWAFPNSVHSSEGNSRSIWIEPKLFSGVVEENFLEGKGWGKTSGRCYQTSLAIEGGTSGGPVFERNGRAFAVNSSSIGPDLGYISHIQSIGGLPLPNIQTSDGVIHNQITIKKLIEDGAIAVDDGKD